MDHLLPYLILAASLAANLFLFFSLKKDIQSLRAKQQDLSTRIQACEEKEEPQLAGSVLAPLRAGFNLNTRVQAMRLWRQGEPPERIAALIGVPSNEVELLLRVRRMTADSATPDRR